MMHRSLRFFALAVLLESCAHDAAGPRAGATEDPPSRMFVSNSRSAASAAASSALSISSGSAAHANNASRTMALAGDEGNVAYISLQPQTNPAGVSAVISNPRLGASVSAPMLDGGLDPVPLPASTGDSVRIEIQNASGVTIETLSSRVLSKRPPNIVRTSPGRGKTGVPLNKNIVVVFTEPVSSISLSSSVQLFHGATQVAGTVEILQGVTASVVFRPAALLEANTDYELVVTQGVRDLDGEALDSVERVPFRTGTAREGLLASLILIPDGANVSVGDQFQLVVIAKDAEGTVLTGHPITWWVDDSTVAHLSRSGLVTARKEGDAIVLAEVDGYFISMFVRVSNAMHPVASVTASVDSASVAPSGTFSVAAVAKDAEGNLLAFRVAHWTTGNSAVATVAATVSDQAPEPFNGYFVTSTALYRAEVTGVANGVTRIIASIEGKSDTIVVTVASSPPIVGLVMSTDTATLLLRQTTNLAGLSVNSAGGRVSLTGTQVQWETSNPAVVSVDATGAVTGVGEGSATITGRWNNYSASAQITVVQIAFETISAGGSHTCALASGGVTYCWGADDFGQSGKPGYIFGGLSFQAKVFTPTPTRVADGLSFVALTTGGFHTCAMTAAGSVYCWGFNGYGALGTNDFADSWRPRPVPAGSFAMIDAGTHHTCALIAAGAAYCWGSNRNGQLGVGNGGPISSTLPARVASGIPFTSLSAGGSHTCALTADGTAYCWGENAGGQLGVGENVTSSPTPLRVSGGLTFASITAGEAHTCGVTRSGTLYCWGWNFENQLGNGVQTTLSSVPVAVASSANFAAVGTGASHTCAIDVSGGGYCWGQNLAGQIGVGTVTPELFATPQSVVGGLSLEKVSAGRSHTCAATIAGVWYCWGDNESGVLGVGNTTDSGNPLKVLGQR